MTEVADAIVAAPQAASHRATAVLRRAAGMNPRRGWTGWKRDVRPAFRWADRRPLATVTWLVGRRGARYDAGLCCCVVGGAERSSKARHWAVSADA